MVVLRGGVAALAFLFAAGCEYSPGLVDRTISYNEAIADSTNKLLVLNTLRASERLPTYYTRSTADTATTTFSPTLSLTVPFGQNAVKALNSFGTTLGSSAQTQLALQNLDDQKFMRGVLTPVAADILGSYLRQGWPAEVLLMVTISKISVSPTALNSMVAAFEQLCGTDKESDYCNDTLPDRELALVPTSGQYLSAQLRNCVASEKVREYGDRESITFENYPTNQRQTDCFQNIMRLIIALGPEQKTVESLSVVARNMPLGKDIPPNGIADLDKANLVIGLDDKQSYTVCRRNKVSGLALSRMPVEKTPTLSMPPGGEGVEGSAFVVSNSSEGAKMGCSELGKLPKNPEQKASVDLTTRSFDGMVYFLGEVLRARHERGGDTTVWARNRTTKRYTNWSLYVAQAGGLHDDGVITVSFGGKRYAIPSACNDTEVCPEVEHQHRSLQVLALLNQIWGLQKETAEMPVVPTVTVVNP